jgi:predicted nucleic acid-binding protein
VPAPTILLDTCVLINLLASDEIQSILHSAHKQVVVCTAVQAETLYLRSEDTEQPSMERVDLRPLIQSGILGVCFLENEDEESLYVDFASQLDDGEAMSLALVLARGFSLATDERKAKRLFLEAAKAPQRLISTADLMRTWSKEQKVSAPTLKETLLRIRRRARFAPSPNDAGYQWWTKACR